MQIIDVSVPLRPGVVSTGDEEAHRALLEAGVVAVEALDLRAVARGEYTLVRAPLKIEGAEGAPARVLLIRV